MLTSTNISNIVADDFKVAVALGQVPGWRRLRKFGMNDGVSSGTEEMWPPGTLKVWPAAAGVVACVSDDSADDAAAVGTGMWTITVEGLDANLNEISETVSLDGAVPVNTTASFLRVNRVYGVTAGTGQTNAGNISCSIGGNLQGYIESGEGQSHQTAYTVPSGHVWVVDTYIISVGRMSGSTDLQVLDQIKLTGANTTWRTISDVFLWNGAEHNNSNGATLLPAGTDVRQLIVSSATTQANSIIDGYLIDQRVL